MVLDMLVAISNPMLLELTGKKKPPKYSMAFLVVK
jgi:hypothetical protein